MNICFNYAKFAYNITMFRKLSAIGIAVILTAGPALAQDKSRGAVEIEPARSQVPLLGEVRTTDIPRSFFYKKVTPIINRKLLLTAGYISADDMPFGKIIHAEYAEKELSDEDIVFIDRGADDGLKEGDGFFVYKRVKMVDDPETGEPLGPIVSILGRLEVINPASTEEHDGASVAKCKITKAYDSIKVGDMIIPEFKIYVPTLDEDRPLKDKNITGRVAAIDAVNKTGSTNDVIYLDVGRDDGVEEGDVFAIYRLPDKGSAAVTYGYNKLVGKARIIMVRGTTATAMVIFSDEEILIGQRVAYVQER